MFSYIPKAYPLPEGKFTDVLFYYAAFFRIRVPVNELTVQNGMIAPYRSSSGNLAIHLYRMCGVIDEQIIIDQRVVINREEHERDPLKTIFRIETWEGKEEVYYCDVNRIVNYTIYKPLLHITETNIKKLILTAKSIFDLNRLYSLFESFPLVDQDDIESVLDMRENTSDMIRFQQRGCFPPTISLDGEYTHLHFNFWPSGFKNHYLFFLVRNIQIKCPFSFEYWVDSNFPLRSSIPRSQLTFSKIEQKGNTLVLFSEAWDLRSSFTLTLKVKNLHLGDIYNIKFESEMITGNENMEDFIEDLDGTFTLDWKKVNRELQMNG